MLHGALAYVLGAWYLHDPWLGLLCALLAGVATAALHALITVTFRADQITSGIGINLHWMLLGITCAIFIASENPLKGFVSLLIGLMIAWPATLLLQKAMPAAMSPFIVCLALVISALTGVLSGFFPAWRAAHMNPVDALRDE